MRFVHGKTALCLILLGLSTSSLAQAPLDLPPSFVVAADNASYADIADLVVMPTAQAMVGIVNREL